MLISFYMHKWYLPLQGSVTCYTLQFRNTSRTRIRSLIHFYYWQNNSRCRNQAIIKRNITSSFQGKTCNNRTTKPWLKYIKQYCTNQVLLHLLELLLHTLFFTNVWNLMINHTYNLYAGENEINCVRCDLNHDILIQ